MTFAAPQMLWLLAILPPALTIFFWWAWRKRQQLITQFISARLVSILRVGVSAARQKLRMAMIVAAVVFLILALARPQWGLIQEEARQRGLDIIVVVDTSNSMLAQDVSPNRLTRVKLAALDLAQRAKTDRLGLVAFAGSAYLECPLTLDDAAFAASVNSLDTKTISDGGTAIAEGIDEAARELKKESGNHKVIVLFTDGEDQDSDAVPAAKKAAENGIIILTVGVGTPEGDMLRITDDQGRAEYIRDESGNPVKSHLNEELLEQIAQAAKGFYLPLRGTRTMDTLYDQGIAPLPKSEYSARYFEHYHERFYWPLGIAMVLLIIEVFLPDRKRRSSRSGAAAAPAPALAAAGVAQTLPLVLLLALPFAARAADPSSALREYDEGRFEDALRDYDRLLDKKSEDPRLHFNAGAAAYQSKKMDEAVREFERAATNSPDLGLQQRAYYNAGNALYRLGQQVDDPQKKQEDWENALRFYTNSLVLNDKDSDAAYNRDFVKRQLEELKKQQSQQSQNSQQQQSKDQQDRQSPNQSGSKDNQQKDSSQQNQNQSQNNQQQQQQQKDQNPGDQSKNQAGQQNQPQSQDQKQDQNQAKNQQDQKQPDKDNGQKQQQNQAGNQPKDQNQSQQEAEQEAAMMAAGEMTPQQAQKLLDEQKNDEQVLRLAPPNNNTSQRRQLKNW